MAIARVQAPTFASGSGTSLSKAFASNVTAGSLLVAFAVTDSSGATHTYTSAGASWTTVATPFLETSSGEKISIGYAPNAPGGATTVQVAWSPSGNFQSLHIAEYSGAATASPLDANTTGLANTTTGAITDTSMTANGADLVVSCVVYNGSTTLTVGASFTLIQSDTTNLFASEDRVLAGAGSTAGAWGMGSTAGRWGVMSACFKPAGAAAAVIPQVNMAPYTAY